MLPYSRLSYTGAQDQEMTHGGKYIATESKKFSFFKNFFFLKKEKIIRINVLWLNLLKVPLNVPNPRLL